MLFVFRTKSESRKKLFNNSKREGPWHFKKNLGVNPAMVTAQCEDRTNKKPKLLLETNVCNLECEICSKGSVRIEYHQYRAIGPHFGYLYLYSCSKNDVISLVRKHYCALELGFITEMRFRSNIFSSKLGVEIPHFASQ